MCSPSCNPDITALSLAGSCNSNSTRKNDEKKLKYPVAVFFITFSGFCERFSYYGMKTVLTLYLRDILLYDENESTVWYHLFTMLCYVTPIFSSILADTYLGKFKTTLWFSCLCASGYVLLSVSSIPNTLPQKEICLFALFIIASGTGGIKPCVSAFGGEQFVRPQQDKQLGQYFSVFYFSMAVGGVISFFITPFFREDIKCFDQNSCFPLAFGVPTISMIVGLVFFIIGKNTYKIRDPVGNVMLDVVKCITHAVGRKIKNKGVNYDHWLEFAGDEFDQELIENIKQVLRVLLLYVPIPIFWALFDQQGSRWTFQATRMDGNLNVTTIKPDQLLIFNPLLVLILVPVFESLIYPCFERCGLLTPLQRIGAGGVLAGLAFVFSGIVELNLEPTYPRIPDVGLTKFTFINTLPCPVSVSYANANQVKWIEINGTSYTFERDLIDQPMQVTAQIISPACREKNFSEPTWNGTIEGASKKGFSVIITRHRDKLELVRMTNEEKLDKSSSGQPRLGFILFQNDKVPIEDHITIKLGENLVNFTLDVISTSSSSVRFLQTDVREVQAGTYDVFIQRQNDGEVFMENPNGKITLLQGGCYIVIATQNHSNPQLLEYNHELMMPILVTPTSSVHMLWLVPQYFVMAAAEVMLSVTGLQFSYTQAPASMRSVMQAAWLLTIGLGNLIVIIVAKAKGNFKQSMEFFLFAGLMGFDMILFFYLAARYTYVEVEKMEVDQGNKMPVTEVPLPSKQNAEKAKERDNKGFTDGISLYVIHRCVS